jgi:hypothetical protein
MQQIPVEYRVHGFLFADLVYAVNQLSELISLLFMER